MKNLILVLVVLISVTSNGETTEKEIDWEIQSKKKDTTIEEGKSIIQGNVSQVNIGGSTAISHMMVGSNNYKTWTDSIGNFEVEINASDTLFFAARFGYTELYIENPEFKSQYRYFINIFLKKKKVKLKKPVIYLYNNQSKDVEITLKPRGDFSFTYPKYKDNWKIRINPNGLLTDRKTNKNYPYLFWEGNSTDLFFKYEDDKMDGWVLSSDTAVSFLENQLNLLGLNEKEKTDFITFWAPIIEQNKYALIQFLVDDAYTERIAEMEIQPKPDASRRIYMLYAPLDNSYSGFKLSPQIFKPFDRKGFTVVEWGGSSLNLEMIDL